MTNKYNSDSGVLIVSNQKVHGAKISKFVIVAQNQNHPVKESGQLGMTGITRVEQEITKFCLFWLKNIRTDSNKFSMDFHIS